MDWSCYQGVDGNTLSRSSSGPRNLEVVSVILSFWDVGDRVKGLGQQ